MRAFWIALGLLTTLPACGEFGKGKDAKIPGDALGSYHVVGKLQASTCGPGALGSSDVWEFDVKLSRDGRDLYWLNGAEAIAGRIAADDVTFAFDSFVEVPAIEPGGGNLGCTIVRTDTASGTLASPGKDVPSFDGLLRFGYAPRPGGDCTPLVGVAGGFALLPCEIGYQLAAKRTGD